ncbi:MAG: zf-HC2 domain-containing protein, partial [Kiritimatiellae bacterium]|nr:zf-HC2 domain-containing protein [Kiritimatiellia bacterium]
MNCEQVKQLLTQYLLGDMDEYASAEIRKHLEKCEGCRTSLREIEPTLDLLRDALAAPSLAPKHLSAEQHAEITRKATNRGRKILRWFIVEHRTLTQVAALFLVGFIVIGMFLPTLVSSRRYARQTAIQFIETKPARSQAYHGEYGKGGGRFVGGLGGEMAGKADRLQIAGGKERAALDATDKISDESGLAYSRSRIPPPGKVPSSEMRGIKSEEAAVQVESLGREMKSASRPFDIVKGEQLGEVMRKAGAYESKKQLAYGEGAAAAREAGAVFSEPTAPMAAAPAAAQQPAPEEKYVDLNTMVKRPKPLFSGTPLAMKGVNLDPNLKEVTKSEITSASQKPASVPAEQQVAQLVAGVSVQSVDSAGKKEREYKKSDEKTLAGKEFTGVAEPKDMEVPTTPSTVTMTKTPVIMKRLYGNRSKGGREMALRKYGKGEEVAGDTVGKLTTEGQNGKFDKDDLTVVVAKEKEEIKAKTEKEQIESVKSVSVTALPAVDKKEIEEDKSGPRFKAFGVNPFVSAVEKPFSTF